MTDAVSFSGYLRDDGRLGIRNAILVIYLVECAHHVARRIVTNADDPSVQLVGFPGCYPNSYAFQIMKQLATHPNVGGVLIVSLGCEGFDRNALYDAVIASGRPAEVLVIQQTGGTRATIDAGIDAVARLKAVADRVKRAPMGIADLVVGTICGGSDGTSGITANPAVGRCFDKLIKAGGTCMFEETGELIGCEQVMAARAVTAELGREIEAAVAKAERYYATLGYGSFAPGNAEGGLTTQEEKSLGAYSKSGDSPISGLIKPGEVPPGPGLYLLDVVPDGEVRFGFPNISDNAEIVELIASGCHLILFTTGRGSVVGSAISPVIKVCANPETYARLPEDMDIDAGRILQHKAGLDEVGSEIFDRVMGVADGQPSVSEALGHQEFILTYKYFEASGPACLPISRP
ncbi:MULTISPECIES: UxaA family hydrolase [Sphingopyxis]|uniref:UxaA family hydrolase n=1 Tax=Sphingopyxis TaxID=165697 RepID=UPI000CDF45EF|nr:MULTISPECIES: UxaA family hydrolase [Sphingopyxis]AVA14919.1 hydrolase [Sphingopyxis sp. MG]QUM73192.1 UxaA family hydrolase [Sphingopyxis granuli]